MAKPNYSYEKRQKELAKQRKKQEKLQRKVHKHDEPQTDVIEQPAEPQSATDTSAPAAQDPTS